MILIELDELKTLLCEESDILIEEIGKEFVYLSYPPLDIDAADIFFIDERYLIEIETLLDYMSDEIFLKPVDILYDKEQKPLYFIVKE